jgi:hypothetical protein
MFDKHLRVMGNHYCHCQIASNQNYVLGYYFKNNIEMKSTQHSWWKNKVSSPFNIEPTYILTYII